MKTSVIKSIQIDDLGAESLPKPPPKPPLPPPNPPPKPLPEIDDADNSSNMQKNSSHRRSLIVPAL